MPLFGRYLLYNYLKVLFLSLIALIAILLVSRLEEIAQFATLGTSFFYILHFTCYQIAYILPIALPISCLISSILLFQRLSETHELTALRAAGIPLSLITAPLLIAASFLVLANFYIASEIATEAHLKTRQIVYDLTSSNPLLLLQSAKIAKIQGSYVQMKPERHGEVAKNLLIAFHGHSNRLGLCLAKKIEMKKGVVEGTRVTVISSSIQDGYDHIMVENQKTLTTSAPELATLLHKQGWKISNDHLKLSLLRIRKKMLQRELHEEIKKDIPLKTAALTKNICKSQCELARRFSIGLAAFTFTAMGIAFGMDISRTKSHKSLIMALVLALVFLIAYFVAKELDHLLYAAIPLYLGPHILLLAASFYMFYRVERGIET